MLRLYLMKKDESATGVQERGGDAVAEGLRGSSRGQKDSQPPKSFIPVAPRNQPPAGSLLGLCRGKGTSIPPARKRRFPLLPAFITASKTHTWCACFILSSVWMFVPLVPWGGSRMSAPSLPLHAHPGDLPLANWHVR